MDRGRLFWQPLALGKSPETAIYIGQSENQSNLPFQAEKEDDAYETVALGSTGVLVGDDNGLENVAELFEVASHGVALSLPCQTSNEDLRERGVSELVPGPGARTRNLMMIRHSYQLISFPTQPDRHSQFR